jgi:hypothetical protein
MTPAPRLTPTREFTIITANSTGYRAPHMTDLGTLDLGDRRTAAPRSRANIQSFSGTAHVRVAGSMPARTASRTTPTTSSSRPARRWPRSRIASWVPA